MPHRARLVEVPSIAHVDVEDGAVGKLQREHEGGLRVVGDVGAIAPGRHGQLRPGGSEQRRGRRVKQHWRVGRPASQVGAHHIVTAGSSLEHSWAFRLHPGQSLCFSATQHTNFQPATFPLPVSMHIHRHEPAGIPANTYHANTFVAAAPAICRTYTSVPHEQPMLDIRHAD